MRIIGILKVVDAGELGASKTEYDRIKSAIDHLIKITKDDFIEFDKKQSKKGFDAQSIERIKKINAALYRSLDQIQRVTKSIK